jgi:hypothetical protein
MRLPVAFLFLFSLLGPAHVIAQTRPELDATMSRAVLRAIGYADLQRAALFGQCQKNSQLQMPVAACRTSQPVPDYVIEDVAIPYLPRYVSPNQAREIMAFWESKDGQDIKKTLIQEIHDNNPHLLSEYQLKLLAAFNKTEANTSMKRFAGNRQLALEIVRAIGSYVP